MKLAIPAIPLLALAALVGVGCATEKPKPATSALDVSTGPQPQAAPPAHQPVAPTGAAALPALKPATPYKPAAAGPKPAARPTAATAETATAHAAEPAGDATEKAVGQTYVVRKGDTLFKIAKTHYGDGAKWQKIADANPGLTPNTIKVGQKIVIPIL